MAYGDPTEEGACFLPGGSRVEAFDVESVSKPSFTRHRFSKVVIGFAATIAVCLAIVTVQNLGYEQTPELLESGLSSSADIVAARTQELPSWLRTAPVKLTPLNQLIKEQEIVRQMAQGRISDKLYKEEHQKSGPSPRQLAMHTLHALAQKKQGAEQQLAQHPHPNKHNVHSHGKAHTEGKHSIHTAHRKMEAHHHAEESHAHNEQDSKAQLTTKTHHVHHGKVARVVKLTPQQELEKDEDLLKMVQDGEKKQEDAIKKQELHKLALLRRKDHAEEASLEKSIKQLEARVSHKKPRASDPDSTKSLLREKAKLKAEMAQLEEEEHEKLKDLQSKLKSPARETKLAQDPAK
mmetsp:Transcript_1690/g.4631  ORF Transcript_1690/g.4631 Transcript_1690/m.4631 type:complete len:350 (+) Transcript_1690:32-1081(+)